MSGERALIRALVPADAEAYVHLRGEALAQEPFAFGASPSDDRALSVDFVRAALADPGQAIFGAFAPRLVGVVGVYHGLAQKTAHKAHLWGLYVTPVHRGQRIGRALVEAAVGFARSLERVDQVHLSVAESALAAASLYERLGFVTWGVEPSALRIGEHVMAERHMMLPLRNKAV